MKFHKDGCPKHNPQINKHSCTCVHYKGGEPNRRIYPDGSGHCREHCYYGKYAGGRD